MEKYENRIGKVKKIIIINIIMSMILLFTICNSYGASTTIFKYDIDDNKKIEENDAVSILKHIVAKKTNTNSGWIIDKEKIDFGSFLEVLRYIEANNKEEIRQKHQNWLNLKEDIILNVKNKEENLNLTTNNNIKIQVDGKNYGKLQFSSKDNSIATVNNDGIITAIKEGSTTITVSDERKLVSENIKVTVSDIKENISINKEKLILDISGKNGEQLIIEGNIDKKLIWTSSDENIATVDENGNVIGIKNGECDITATTTRGNKAICKVIVQTSPTEIEVKEEIVNLILKGNKEHKISYTIKPNTANVNTEVTYKSLNTQIATVDNQGNIIGVSEGNTIIEISTKNGKKTTCRVNVIQEEAAPTITIKKSYEGDILTAGENANFQISIKGNNIKNIDNSKISFTGTLADKINTTITGKENEYKLTIQIPDEMGTLGFEINSGFVTNLSDKTNEKVVLNEQNVFKLETTTSDNSITTAIGVFNSFYIKDYDFYINNEMKAKDRTTNEYTFENLEEGKTYEVKVYVKVYKNKTSDDIITGWLQKSIKVEKNNGAEVHFINVTKRVPGYDYAGAGDCIFIKTSNGKTIMIDTGAETSGDGYINFVPTIDKYLRIDKNGKDGSALVNAENGIVNVDYLILTHEHWDHIGGFQDLTGILYKRSSPGYLIDENNTINGTKVRYNFGKIVVGCNIDKYNPDDIIGSVADGAKKSNTTQSAMNKAIYCYATDKGKLECVNSGNTIKIDDTILNIYNPYPYEDVPGKWLASNRSAVYVYYSGGTAKSVGFSEANNNSVVIKLLCGSRKMLLMGDAEFLIEEMLLGIPSVQIKNNDSSKNGGLRIDSSNGGLASYEQHYTDYASLVRDLISNKYGGCSTISELEQKYKISRLTPKDLSAQVLKKGHHGVANTTSIPFLNSVRPNKIVSTGESSNGNYDNSIIGCVNTGPDYCIRSYYNSSYSGASGVAALNFSGGQIKLTSNNWYYFVFGTDNISYKDGNDRGKGSFYIATEDGNGWDYSDPYNK